MTNEIKEILHSIKECCDIHKDENWVVYQKDRIYQLLDNITNLQEENERIRKDYFTLMQDNAYTLELEQRIDKAVEYIENDIDLTGINGFEKLLDILRGDE